MSLISLIQQYAQAQAEQWDEVANILNSLTVRRLNPIATAAVMTAE